MDTNCYLLQTKEIQAIIGDGTRGAGATTCGLWSLTSVHNPFNVIGNTTAGLYAGPLRERPKDGVKISRLDSQTCILSCSPTERYPTEVSATYTFNEPFYIDHSLTYKDLERHQAPGHRFSRGFMVYLHELARGPKPILYLRREMEKLHVARARGRQQYSTLVYTSGIFGKMAGRPPSFYDRQDGLWI